jgi:exodeoxyribonuclease V alpha subunit
MVDVPLAWHLFEAVDLLRTTVLLVGDHNQLPPVGPGNILRDLIQTRAIPTVILDKVVRQAGVLKENCTAVLKGEVRKTSEASVAGCRDWYLVDQFTDPMAARSFLLELFQERLDALGFDIIKDVQVLTPTHKGPLGTKELNEELQRLIQRKLWNTEVPPVTMGRRAPFLKHDKVIQTRNNYDLNVMNGAIGYVVDVLAKGTLVIDFDGMPVELEKGSPDLQDLQLAYALTIHKTQGSEFPCAVVVVHKAHSFMHHRNLLYTGVTRARRTAIVLGDHWGIQNCAKRCQVDDRRTFLPLFLDAAQHAEADFARVAEAE